MEYLEEKEVCMIMLKKLTKLLHKKWEKLQVLGLVMAVPV